MEIRTRFNLIHEKEWTGDTILLFVKDMVYPERRTISGIRDTNRKG